MGSRPSKAYVFILFTFPSAVLAIALRLLARRLTRVHLGLDDYLSILALIFAGAYSGCLLRWLQFGLGLHLIETDPKLHMQDLINKSRLLLWLAELMYGFSLGFTKLAILAFYWRLFKTSSIRTPIRILAACSILWMLIRIFLNIFQCVPVQAFWILDGFPSAVCTIDEFQFMFGTVLTHAIIDIAILALPVIELYKLQMLLSQRLGIIIMFMFGIFVCAASIVVLVYIRTHDHNSIEIGYEMSRIVAWWAVEVNFSIVSACLPMLRPIYLLVLRRPLPQDSPNKSNTLSQSRSGNLFSRHKMGKISVPKTNANDATSSMYALASPSRDGSSSQQPDYHETGIYTVVTGAGDGGSGEQRRLRKENHRNEARWSGIGDEAGKILVTSEMSIRSDRLG